MRDWRGAAEALLPEMIALRRAIHAEPELGLHTPLTTKKVREALNGLPLEYRESTSTSGFVAVLRGAKAGRAVLLRADMDALPLTEKTGLAFSSRYDNAMHACGHDAHSAMLVAAARMLCSQREQLAGAVLFMFQPGEEGWHGARHMLEDGVLDPLADAAFALHVAPNAPVGLLASRAGPMLAAADRFEITIRGRGGHASSPHEALDPMPVAFELGTAIHAMVTRRIPAFDPVVVTIGAISSGSASNAIPETAFMEGTIRSFSESSRTLAHEGLARLAANIAAAHLCKAEIEIERGFPVTACDGRAVALARQTAVQLFGPEAWIEMAQPAMGSEDFSYVLECVPGAMVFLGAAPQGSDWRTCCSLHADRMVIDEAVMARGAAMHCALAEGFLTDGFHCV